MSTTAMLWFFFARKEIGWTSALSESWMRTRSTQTEPMAGGYYRKEGQRTECCVLSVLYLHQFGVAALESLVEQFSPRLVL